MNTVKAQGRDGKPYAKVRRRWGLKTVPEFSMQNRKEGPSRQREPGDTEAAQDMMRS